MRKVIDILRADKIRCWPNERLTPDTEIFAESGVEYPFPKQALFEDPELPGGKKRVPDGADIGESMFRFFLDGSQRSYHVMDGSFNNRYLPICAGQVGVAVIERNSRKKLVLKRELTDIRFILALPNLVERDRLQELQEKMKQGMAAHQQFSLVRYNYDAKAEKDPRDLARAMIIHEMQMLELNTIREMIRNNLIDPKMMLVKDGGLQYRDTKIRDLGLSNEDFVQLRNVIGLAKSFQPNMTLGQGRNRQDLGNLTKGLAWKERTCVISPDKDKAITRGWWYLRIRPQEKVFSPLQGIVKIEVFADSSEKNNEGIPEARADTISSYVLQERNVTPYDADTRWASHIYPVYLAETYLKSSFLSHARFKAIVM